MWKTPAVIQRLPWGTAIVVVWLGAVRPAGAVDITLDGGNVGRTFEGLGAVSAGASSRLLIDYPEPQRSEILDFLFKPNYGAALQHLKVEIGGDVNSTDGCEPSHQHSRNDTNFNRGYEWWLMKEAKARNPNIILDCLAWGAPGWIGNGNYWSQDMANYVVNFIKGAKEVHGLDIEFTGVRNEVINNTNWIITLRNTLNAAGLANVKIVAGDEWGGTWKIVDDALANPGLSNAIYAIGTHYPSHHGYTSPPIAKTFSQPLWASEEGIGGATWAKALSLAKLCNRNYIVGKMTKTEIWSPVTAYYDLLAAAGSGLMRANSPWSGNYSVSPAIWATTHTTQFASPGWKYLEGTGNGFLPGGGSYVTLKSTNSSDFSIVIETADASAAQSVTFHLTNGLTANSIHVWRTSSSQQFVHVGNVSVSGDMFTIVLDPACIYTLTTTTGQVKGATTPPSPKEFPIPYSEDFETYADGATPGYFSDQSGIFEIVPRADGKGNCLRQVTTSAGIPWAAQFSPYTILGNQNWRDYEVSTEVFLETNGAAYVYGRIADIPGFSDPMPRGYWLKAESSGKWELQQSGNLLASGNTSFAINVWHRLKLSFAGDNVKAFINGEMVANVQDAAHANGLVGIGCGRHGARFDNFFVAPRHRGALNLAPGATASASSYWQKDPTYAASQAADDNEVTRWNAAGNDQAGAWLMLDFGAPTVFNRTYVSQFDDRIAAFKIQYWSGATWQDLVVSTSNLGPSRVDFFEPVTASRVRFLVTAANNVPSLFEFAVSYHPSVENLALGATPSASSFWENDPTYSAAKINDGNLSTRWNAHALDGVNCWVQLDFGVPKTFNKTALHQFLNRITGYEIQYWIGSAWATAVSGGQFGSVRTDFFSPVTSSKVRFLVTSATNIPSIYEFQVFHDAPTSRTVFINEWMPHNTSIPDLADGDAESWFELFNPGNELVDLAGWYLSGNPLNRFQFQIPPGYTLPPKEFLLAWADGEPGQNSFSGDLHVSFELSESSVIGLYSPTGEQVDLVDLMEARPGESYGSRTDGNDLIMTTVVPTPRESNQQIRITSLTAPVGGSVEVKLSGIPEATYRLWAADDPDGIWTEVGVATPGANGTAEFTDNTSSEKRFYRATLP